ncbi:hypothetical protein L7F22_030571 [Adiantum nelumboides]|nr:hypothetical protein [Adiantum nelumboides]
MVPRFTSYLESFLYLFEAEIDLIGKFLVDIWWFELTLEIYVECMDVFAMLQVENNVVFEVQDLKVEASCVIEMYKKAAVFVNMKSIMEEVSALEEVPSSLELPQVLKLAANVFLRKLWFSGAQSTVLVGSFDFNQDAFEMIYNGGF